MADNPLFAAEKLRAILDPAGSAGQFTVTVCFPRSGHADFPRALELAQSGPGFREQGEGENWHACASFDRRQADDLYRLFELARELPGARLFVNHRPLPCLQELWLPLMWFYRVH